MQSCYQQFLDDPFRDLKLNAAMIGISDRHWEYVRDDGVGDETTILSRMRSKRYDVMPILCSGETREYFATATWNDYSVIVRRPITAEDLIPYDTNLREVIRRFAIDNRHFYFLSGPKPIVGLISVANLNSRKVKVYLYNLIAELEIKLAGLLPVISDEDMSAMAERRTAGFAESCKYYEEARSKGVDSPFNEYLILSTMINIAVDLHIHEKIGYSRTRFKKLGKLITLRNEVAHPTRSIITNPASCNKLWDRLEIIEEFLTRLCELEV